jgi:gliding motility-associated-like protein
VKKEVKILIFDRFGKKIFSNENSTSYIWDGTENGRPLPSGSYWYILEWTEPDTGIKINNKGWILLKNRN